MPCCRRGIGRAGFVGRTPPWRKSAPFSGVRAWHLPARRFFESKTKPLPSAGELIIGRNGYFAVKHWAEHAHSRVTGL